MPENYVYVITATMSQNNRPTTTSFEIFFNESIKRIKSIALVEATIPYSFYCVNDTNDTLHVKEYNSSSVEINDFTINIRHGIYDYQSFGNYILDNLNSNTALSYSYQFTDSETGEVSIFNSDTGTYNRLSNDDSGYFQLFWEEDKSPYLIMGAPATNSGLVHYIDFSYVANLNISSCIIIRIREITFNNSFQNGRKSNILAAIGLDTSGFTYIKYNPNEIESNEIPMAHDNDFQLDKITIDIEDENGNLLNLNGQNLFMKLKIVTV
jgi:hypothetical protein